MVPSCFTLPSAGKPPRLCLPRGRALECLRRGPATVKVSAAGAHRVQQLTKKAMNQAFICDAVRTPFGRYGGALATIRTDDLAAIPLGALAGRNPGVDWQAVD